MGLLSATVIFACACMHNPVQAEPIQEPQSKPVMVPYTNQTVQQFANINNYRKMQLSEEDATFPETCTNRLECVGTVEPTYVEDEPEPEQEDDGWVYYGECRITHYCPESCCCGEWATGCTASGVLATINHTVATGEDLPFGTEVMINGQVYVVEDRGVEPYEIDIFVSDHETAEAMGMYYTDVYVRYHE